MKITIIRHAEPDYANNTLTEKGFKEADFLGKYYSNEIYTAVYSSPYNRARYTADALVKYNKTKTYKVLDFLREFDSTVNLPYLSAPHGIWDLRPSYLNDNVNLYSDWQKIPEMATDELLCRYKEVYGGLESLLNEHGYRKNGVYFETEKGNHEHICLVCHFGLESILLSYLLNVSPHALLNHTCAMPSAVTTVVTEEREKGKAIFRMLTFGSVEHLKVNGETPSFMARFDEVYGDGYNNVK